jgi:pimeloyl-ACP methyl ester carboxylesterase
MVLWGEHDAMCPPTIGQSIADMIPDARLVVIEGAAHDPMWEQPDRFDEEVVDFLGG